MLTFNETKELTECLYMCQIGALPGCSFVFYSNESRICSLSSIDRYNGLVSANIQSDGSQCWETYRGGKIQLKIIV